MSCWCAGLLGDSVCWNGVWQGWSQDVYGLLLSPAPHLPHETLTPDRLGDLAALVGLGAQEG